MLGVVQPDTLTQHGIEPAGDLRVRHGKSPDLWRHAADDVERKLALGGLAHEALARELLQDPHALAFGIRPSQYE